ncbi:hypothetical protein NN561_010316 [Cricetulus griseus]
MFLKFRVSWTFRGTALQTGPAFLSPGAKFTLSRKKPQNPSLRSSPAAVRGAPMQRFCQVPTRRLTPTGPRSSSAERSQAPVFDDQAKRGSLGHCSLNWSWPYRSPASQKDRLAVLQQQWQPGLLDITLPPATAWQCANLLRLVSIACTKPGGREGS